MDRDGALRADELEVEALREQVRCLAEEVRRSDARASERDAEARQQSHTNSQLKQVIDQMREVSRNYNEERAAHARSLGDALSAKESAEQEALSVKMLYSEVQEELERALQETDQRSTSGQEQATLSKQLRQAQARLEEAREDKHRQEQASAAALASSQALHQAALQREQQLGGVLEAFHEEKATEVEVMNKRRQEDLASQAASFEATELSLKRSFEARLSEQAQTLERDRLKDRRAEAVLEGENARIKEDLAKSRAALEAALLRLSGSCDDTLDRQLVTNLIVRYVSSHHKKQVLELMARMFNFTEEEKEQVGLSNRGPTLPGMLTAMFVGGGQDGDHDPEAATAEAKASAGEALGDLWVDFLMAETTEESGQRR
ncbi:conserved unknown protein [Ectocarpus siliculosus]|uniref:GRIP domain-containing protein n=1 Tax=Ectocarpus siliculosus TaxID=2880 RepID=D7FV12_ECTSI|nr:conserved unknown protein [Ectocarpus siliculosus]|eukprot:CBJ31818.1 conserved unknown protein [Ectocarpus siliculosus]